MYELGKCNKGYYIEQLNSILKKFQEKESTNIVNVIFINLTLLKFSYPVFG